MKHNMFTHFLGWFNEPLACYDCITFFWIIISPTLGVSYQKLREEEQFITEDIIRKFHMIFKHHLSIKKPPKSCFKADMDFRTKETNRGDNNDSMILIHP